MIVEISYWKQEFIQILAALKEAISEMEKLEQDIDSGFFFDKLGSLNFELEKCLFMSALGIRRVFEADSYTRKNDPNRLEWKTRTISKGLKSKNYQFPTKKSGDKSERMKIHKFVSEIIHSQYLSWAETPDGRLEGFWLASKFNEKKRVYLVKWDQYFSILKLVIDDRPDNFGGNQ